MLIALQKSSQRGAISIMAAASMTALVAAALLMVDLGNLFFTKRHLQSVADNAALSAVNDPSNAEAIAKTTAVQNGFAVPGTHGNTLTAVVGQYDETTPDGTFQGTFRTGVDPALNNAVQVTVSTQEPYFFVWGNRLITATATAVRQDIAAFSIGSGLVSLDTNRSILLNAILGKLLHTSIHLDAASYNGLANANVSLLDLVKADADVGTLQGLLDANVSVAELINLTATALDQSGIADVDVAIAALDLLGLTIPGDLKLNLGDLLKVSLADGSTAADARINVLQLIMAAAQVANGEHFLNVPIVGINLPGIVSLNLALSLIEPPTIAVGPAGKDSSGNWLTRAHTAQMRLKLSLDLLPVLGHVVYLPLYLELAQGDAWLESIQCRIPRDDSTVTIGATSGIAGVYVGEVNEDAMTNREAAIDISPAKVVNLELFGLPLLTLETQAAVELPGGAATLEFTGPFDEPQSQRVYGLDVSGLFTNLIDSLELKPGGLIGELLNILLGLLGLTLEGLIKLVLAVLVPVGALLDAILNPVLSLLGLQLGFADVTLHDVTCGVAHLVR